MKKLPRVTRDAAFYMRVFQASYDWTDREVGAYFGIGPAMWSLLKARKRNAGPQLAEKISEATGADFKELLMGAK